MKKFIALIMTAFVLSISGSWLRAQTGPPDPPGEHGTTTDQPQGGGAGLGSGIGILLGLVAAYTGKKLRQLGNETVDEE